jgi:class 3 adenylate cyclase/tetratricopeptide (TPR) repeat protein
VLFADLKGSMEMLANRDPEEAHGLLDPVLERMIEAVHRYEGTVNQVMGDGIMALFGAPLAHEDHALRACHAALRMQESVKRYAREVQRTHGVAARIRVGLNSGEVVVRAIGNDLHMDYSAVGQTTHLAARMEQLASADSILVTRATLELVGGFVSTRPLGPVTIKGLTGPIEAYELTAAGPVRTRLQVAAQRGLSPFVGREAELGLLRHAQRRAAAGHGQVVAVIGEAGVGKSRLVYEFTRSEGAQGWYVLESGAGAYGKTPSYFQLIELLAVHFKIQNRDDLDEVREKVTAAVRRDDTALPALLALFHVPVDDPGWRALDPAHRRERTLDAVKRLMLREARERPLLLVFEDVQLIDPETQAVLDGLIDSLGAARMLLLVNYRPEYRHTWGGKSYYSQIRLDMLAPENTRELLDTLLGTDAGLLPLKQILLGRGNPFFLEETVRTLVETKTLAGAQGRYRLTQPVTTIQVPPTVQAVLAARIDRLPPESKHLLQVASVAGNEVPFALLQAITDLSEDALRRSLEQLQAAEFLAETGLFPDREYSFTHSLTLDVAYGTLLRGRRREMDARIVTTLERLYPAPSATTVERLAHHAFRGEVWDRAVRYGREAAARSFARSTLSEALGHVERALEALAHLPETPERRREELELVTERATALRMLHGYAAPEVEPVYLKARELASGVPDVPERFGLEWQQMQFHLVRAEMDTAAALAAGLLEQATARQDRPLLLDAHLASGMAAFQIGSFETARDHFERGLAFGDAGDAEPRVATHGQHPDIFCQGYLAWTLWFVGQPGRAQRLVEAAIEAARARAHPFTYVSALMFGARVFYGCLEIERVKALGAEITTRSQEHGFAYYEAQGRINEGWARVLADASAAGYELLRDGCAALEKTGTILGLKGALVKAVEACQRLGRLDEARATLDRLDLDEPGGARAWDVEIARLRAELAPSPAEAAGWYRRAITIARAQGARSLELRAALRYAETTNVAPPGEEARELLAAVVGRLTEDVEPGELRAARALLGT